MDGVLVTISKDELAEVVKCAVADALSAADLLDSWGASGTVSFEDVRERYGVSLSTCIRMMNQGKFPQPVNSRTREYRFRQEDVIAAFERVQHGEHKTAIRPDMRSGRRANG